MKVKKYAAILLTLILMAAPFANYGYGAETDVIFEVRDGSSGGQFSKEDIENVEFTVDETVLEHVYGEFPATLTVGETYRLKISCPGYYTTNEDYTVTEEQSRMRYNLYDKEKVSNVTEYYDQVVSAAIRSSGESGVDVSIIDSSDKLPTGTDSFRVILIPETSWDIETDGMPVGLEHAPPEPLENQRGENAPPGEYILFVGFFDRIERGEPEGGNYDSLTSYATKDINITAVTGGGEGPGEVGDHRINLSYDGSQGSIKISGDHRQGDFYANEGDRVHIEIESGFGYKIFDVKVDGSSIGKVTQYEIQNIDKDYIIEVEFEPAIYTITATAGENGTINPSGVLTVEHDRHQSFEITPNNGYRIKEVKVDGQSEGDPPNPYEFRHVREDHTIHATFERKGEEGRYHTVTVDTGAGGTVTADGLVDGKIIVGDCFDQLFTITPDNGYVIEEVILYDVFSQDDIARWAQYNGDDTFSLIIEEVRQDLSLTVNFKQKSFEDILFKSYVVTKDNANNPGAVAEALADEFGFLGYVIDPSDITVTGIDTDNMIKENDYGTFSFTVKIGDITSDPTTGYIVNEAYNIMFEYTDSKGENPEIRVMELSNVENLEFGVPAMASGFINVYGPYNTAFEGGLSPDVEGSLEGINRNKMQVVKPFYRAQFHMGNAFDRQDPKNVNLYGLDLIQDDAYCVQVSASSETGEQMTQWDFNRYAQLTTGDYTSKVFFGNDVFTLSIPESGIGGLESLSVVTGDFPGYTVSKIGENSYEVKFLSDFYDNIVLNLTLEGINGQVNRKLTVHRVGVHIEEYTYHGDDYFHVFHGTQYGTLIDFSNGKHYHIYATYYIPDFGITAPYGLYVTYKWKDGSTTTETISMPCDSPAQGSADFSNGVFLYKEPHNQAANCCDYLLYEGSKAGAPISVNVIVLKDDPRSLESFGGVHFGSGNGVEWIRK